MSECCECAFAALGENFILCASCARLHNGAIDNFMPLTIWDGKQRMEVMALLKKPPMGLRPRVLVLAHRAWEIKEAIDRYLASEYVGDREIPLDWVREYNGCVRELQRIYKKNRLGENRSGER